MAIPLINQENWSNRQRKALAAKMVSKLAGGGKEPRRKAPARLLKAWVAWRFLIAGALIVAAAVSYDFHRKNPGAARKIVSASLNSEVGRYRFPSLETLRKAGAPGATGRVWIPPVNGTNGLSE